ncbi:hypothetical protein I352_00513 [Cryptococcus deuterogattii MMRL2647]|nr:hypothetical protein I352_00513 [Cryptococcus deuterogattii MMRL2647]
MQPPPNQLPDSPPAAHLSSFFTLPSKTDSFQLRELLKTFPESSHNSQHGRSSKDEAPYSFPHNKPSHPYIGPSIPKLPSSNLSQSELLQPLLAQELFVHNKGRKIMTASDRIMKAIEDLNDRLASVQQDVIMLKSDSRHTRDQLHDLQLGQRLLPVRDEIADEITNILTPVIQDSLQSITHCLDNVMNSIAQNLTGTFFPRLDPMTCGLEKVTQTSKRDTGMNLEEQIKYMSDVIKKLDDSLEAQRHGSRVLDDCKKFFDRFEQLIGSSMNPNDRFIQNSLQELHVKVNQLSAPSQPFEYAELNKHVTHLVASSASITRVFDELRLILSNQTHLKMLIQHLLRTCNSSNLQNLPYQHEPLSSTSQHLSLDYLSKAFLSETSSTQLLSTQSGTIQSNSQDDFPLRSDGLADVFGSESYIAGPVNFPCSTAIQEMISLNPHAASQSKPSSNLGVSATVSSKICSASTAGPSSLINAQTPHRQTRQGCKSASHSSSHAVQYSGIPDRKESVLQPLEAKERDIANVIPTEEKVSKGKKRTWDFSSDEEADET